MNTLTLDQFQSTLKAQGVPRLHLALICPVCGTVQSPADLIAAGAGASFEEVETKFGFSCIGRFTQAGPWRKDEPPGRGCDWTLGGLFRLHKLEVIGPDGKAHPFFEIASPDQAQAHWAKQAAPIADAESA